MLDTPEDIEAFFKHAGVKGMKWGKRKADGSYKNLQKAQKKYDKALNSRSNQIDAYNKAARFMNNGFLDKLNTKYKTLDMEKNPNSKAAKSYIKEFDDKWDQVYTTALTENIGARPK